MTAQSLGSSIAIDSDDDEEAVDDRFSFNSKSIKGDLQKNNEVDHENLSSIVGESKFDGGDQDDENRRTKLSSALRR